ncbi:MAG: 2-oxoacid:acceptor oxidoreductase subunit alpha [Candidatus Helarchaeales archaeon]
MKAGRYFVLGNIACAEGAIYAGCNFFAGYPITPASEITEYLSRELPKIGGRFLQMEDEIASCAAAIGASWAGAKSMTATSGPGFSLMQENISYAYHTETPLVIVDVQRSGPSTGQATYPAQQDFYQARHGAHGDYQSIVLSPWSVQETFDMTIRAFNLAEKYRVPVILLMDGAIAHAKEELLIPEHESIKIENRKRLKAGEKLDPSLHPDHVLPMGRFGDGLKLLVTGSAHEPSGKRNYSPSVHEETIKRICSKITSASDIMEIQSKYLENSKMAVISYGVSARPSLRAVEKLRSRGVPVGFIRLKTLWPFPDRLLQDLLQDRVSSAFVVEMNIGKAVREVQRAIKGIDVSSISKLGGVVPNSEEIVERVLEVAT